MKIVMIDDELDSLNMLEIEIKKAFPNFEIIAKFNNASEAIQQINALDFDVLFLDIQMPEYNGFEVLQKIEHANFDIVFLTAYSEYAIEAIKAKAFDYLLKPIDTYELVESLNKIIQKQNQMYQNQMNFFLSKINEGTSNRIRIPTQDGISFLDTKDIIYCKAESNYTHIFTTDQVLFISKTLKHLEELLKEYQFIRTHQSYLVNPTHIKEYKRKDGGYLLLSNGHTAYISKNKRDFLSE